METESIRISKKARKHARVIAALQDISLKEYVSDLILQQKIPIKHT